MATPERGICSVAQVEQLTRPASKYGDFKYHNDTQPTDSQVAGYVDMAYDKILPLFVTCGLVIPIVEPITLNYCAVLNAYKTAIDIETGVHSNAPPKSTTKGQKLQTEYDLLLKALEEKLRLPAAAINNDRPLIDLHEVMWSTMVDLYDKGKYDEKTKEAFFRADKKF